MKALPPPDAAIPDAPPAPKLVCDPGESIVPGPAPEPTLYCTREGGVRQGPFVSLFPDGTIEIEGTYKAGKLDGPWKRHHPNGQLAEDGQYTAGQKDGHWRDLSPTGAVLGEYDMKKGTGTEKRWYDEGPLYSERQLRNGMAWGFARTYLPDGKHLATSAKYWYGKLDGPHQVGSKTDVWIDESFTKGVRTGKRSIWVFLDPLVDENYDDKGKLDGAWTMWRKLNHVKVQGVYDHGKRIGTWTWFDRQDNKEKEGDYQDGKKTGPWFDWLDNKLVASENYTDGKPDGEFVYYDHNGNELGRFTITGGTGTMLTFHPNKKVATEQKLVDGEPEGAYKVYSFRGKLLLFGRFSSGKKHGRWHEQLENEEPVLDETWRWGRLDGKVKKYAAGKVVEEATYKAGKAEGPYTELRDGKPALTGQFVADRRDGTWTTYDPNGSVVLIATYKAGVLDGPWKQLSNGVVIEGTMKAGRRTGTWTRTDRSGQVQTITY